MTSVLFVDDEALILNSLKRGLMDEPYAKFFATSADDALKIMEKEEIGVLVTDMKMPGMSGLDLLKIVKERYPDTIKLVLSGYTQLPQVLATINHGDIFKFITKPWELDAFKDVIRESVDYYNYRNELTKHRNAIEKKNATFQNLIKTYDDRMIAMKDEVSFMRDMSRKWLQQIMRILLVWNPKTDSKERLVEDINRIQAVMMEAFALIPIQEKRFHSKQIQEDLRRVLLDKKVSTRVEFHDAREAAFQGKGRYELILFLIKNVMLWSFANDPQAHVVVIFEGQDSGNGRLLKTVMEGEARWFQSGPVNEKVRLWLGDWAERFDSRLEIKDIGDKKAVVLSIACEA